MAEYAGASSPVLGATPMLADPAIGAGVEAAPPPAPPPPPHPPPAPPPTSGAATIDARMSTRLFIREPLYRPQRPAPPLSFSSIAASSPRIFANWALDSSTSFGGALSTYPGLERRPFRAPSLLRRSASCLLSRSFSAP